MKKRTFIAFILIVVIALIIYFVNKTIIKPELDDKEIENLVKGHLHNKGFNNQEYTIDVSYHWDSKLLGYNPYVIKVVFKDDPNTIYYYKYLYKTTGEIIQEGVSSTNKTTDKNFKHLEKD